MSHLFDVPGFLSILMCYCFLLNFKLFILIGGLLWPKFVLPFDVIDAILDLKPFLGLWKV